MASPAPSPSQGTGLRSPPHPEAPKESAVSRLLIAPLTFISFLLSLALVDSRNHSLRTRSHTHSNSPGRGTDEGWWGAVKGFLHAVIWKRVPGEEEREGPYGYVRSPNTERERKDGRKQGERWYWHTKQRKMMKKEMDDAFRIRRSIMVGLVGVGILGVLGAGLVGRWMWVVLRAFLAGGRDREVVGREL